MRAPAFPSTLVRAVVAAVLGDAVAARTDEGALPATILAPYAERIKQLSERFTGETKGSLPRYLDDPLTGDAYTLYYLFINATKVAALLSLPAIHARLSQRPLRIAELGCGPGAGLVGALTALEGVPSLLTGIDHSNTALIRANRIFGAIGASFFPLCSDLEDMIPDLEEPQDIIIIANTLNELWRVAPDAVGRRVRFLSTLAEQHLAQEGILLIIEPALKSPSRELGAVRDHLLRNGQWHILHPCTHHHPCPVATLSDEWCHDLLSWEAPPLVRQLDEMTGFNKHRLKFSALVLKKGASADNPHRWYVFNEPRTSKGLVELTACGEPGLVRMMLSRRAYSEKNRLFKKLSKGEKFSLKPTKEITETSYRLSAEDEVLGD